jgi:hypothetical protein
MVEDGNDAELVVRDLRSGGFPVVSKLVDRLDDVKVALEAETWDVVLCDPGTPLVLVSGATGERPRT